MKKVLFIFGVIFSTLFVLCFLPFNADKFIPILENQVKSQYGVSLHTDKLIFQIGPSIVVKSPSVKLFYGSNEKFAELSGVKIQIDILPLIRHKVKLNSLRIDNADLTLLTDKKGKLILSNYVKPCKEINAISKIKIKIYNILVNDNNKQKYNFIGSDFAISDFVPNKKIKLVSKGILSIGGIKHCDYDVAVALNNLNFIQSNSKIDILDFLSQIKNKNVKASLVADLKIKKTKNGLKTDGFLSLDKTTFMLNGYQLPYSNANFVMLGNKTSVSSTLYADKNSRIVLNGFINNSENPSFNISVKSNKIDLKNILSLSRLFSDISNLDKIKDINGTLYANFSLKGTLKHIKSDGFFKISDANIYTDSINVTRLNSDIDFSDNKILIKSTKAFLNSAPVIVTGNIISNKINLNLIIDKFRLKNYRIKNIDIDDGIFSVVANISGSYKNINPKIESELVNFSGRCKLGSFRAHRVLFKSLNKNIGTASISNLFVQSRNSKPIIFPLMNASFDNSNIIVSPFKVLSGKTQIDLSGTISEYKTENLLFSIKGKGSLNPNDLFKIPELNNSYPVIVNFTGNKTDRELNCQLLQRNSNAKLSFSYPVIVNLNSKLLNTTLKINDLSVNSFKGIFTNSFNNNLSGTSKYCVINGSVENLFNPILKNVKVNILKPLPVNFYHYNAKVTGNLVINGSYHSPEVIGNLKVPILADKYGCLFMRNISLALTKKKINFDCGLIKIFDSVISCVGSADTKFDHGIRVKSINLKSKQLDLDNLSWFLLLAKRSPLKPTVEDGSMFSENVLVQSPNGTLHLTDLNSSFNIINNIMSISDISANLYNGKVVGNMKLNIPDDRYVGTIQGRSVSARPVMKSLTSLKENISGKMDFDMGVASSLSSKYLKKANIKFIIRDGQMSVLGKVEHLLYAQNIVSDSMLKTSLSVISRAITSRDTGLFHYMAGVVIVNKDMVTIKSIQTQGPNMSTYVTGYYGLTSGLANLNILGRLSNTFVSSLGSFGTFTMDKFKTALTGESDETSTSAVSGIENIPPLPQRSTKEFKAVITGPIEAPSSVRTFMWISESEKQYRTREVPMNNVGIPKFIENLPY